MRPAAGETFVADDLRAEIRRGLTAKQKRLPSKYLYDEVGSALFEAICGLPAYTLTRTERAILERHAADIVAHLEPDVRLVELGAGSAVKTRILLRELLRRRDRILYIPIDISEEAMRSAEANITSRFPQVIFKGVVDDWLIALERLTRMERNQKLVLFLGSSIGNLDRTDTGAFLARLSAAMAPTDQLLLGTDMVRPVAELLAAYDDPAGVTAAFNRNILVRCNEELAADFDARAFRHEARWDAQNRRIEMHLVARRRQTVTLHALDLRVRIEAGESIHTEDSHKFTPDDVSSMAQAAGLRRAGGWHDGTDRFRLTLLERA